MKFRSVPIYIRKLGTGNSFIIDPGGKNSRITK